MYQKHIKEVNKIEILPETKEFTMTCHEDCRIFLCYSVAEWVLWVTQVDAKHFILKWDRVDVCQ